MAEIYVSTPGSVAVIKAQGTIPGTVEITDTQGGKFSAYQRIIITAMGYNQSCNVQFLQTLNNSIYVYSFGDRMGEVQIQGLAFSSLGCGGGGTGLSDIMEYYRANRLSKTGTAISIAAGAEVIKGFLIGLRILTQNTETATYSWVMEIAGIPDQSDIIVGAGTPGTLVPAQPNTTANTSEAPTITDTPPPATTSPGSNSNAAALPLDIVGGIVGTLNGIAYNAQAQNTTTGDAAGNLAAAAAQAVPSVAGVIQSAPSQAYALITGNLFSK